MKWLICGIALELLCGCRRVRELTLVRRVVHRVKSHPGWYREEGLVRLVERDQPAQPIPGPDEDLDDVEDIEEVYDRQLSPLEFDDDERGCAALTGNMPPPAGPVFIFVPGVRGDGPEWWPIASVLERRRPAGMFLYRWFAGDEHGPVVHDFLVGASRIARCFPGARPLVVLAHSAGGLVSSFAVEKLRVPEGSHLWLLTVASPLAGVGYRAVNEDDGPDTQLFNDLGTSRTGFAPAAPRISVIHFRTVYPDDPVMKPNLRGHHPNARGVGVPGAREVEIPGQSHDGSLLYIAQQLAAGVVP